jgi:RimJ/RimL family protein N-acetyltransferase
MGINNLDITKKIETERLYLRAYRAGDGAMYYAARIRNRVHLSEFESGNVIMLLENEKQAEEIIGKLREAWMAGKHFLIGVFDKSADHWVGQIYVEPTNLDLPEFTVGYAADVNYEGKGYISEAVKAVLAVLFIDLGAHRVKADCHENNVRSWRLLERCGFKREGHLRENKKNPDGSFHGDLLYSILRPEYLVLNPQR